MTERILKLTQEEFTDIKVALMTAYVSSEDKAVDIRKRWQDILDKLILEKPLEADICKSCKNRTMMLDSYNYDLTHCDNCGKTKLITDRNTFLHRGCGA